MKYKVHRKRRYAPATFYFIQCCIKTCEKFVGTTSKIFRKIFSLAYQALEIIYLNMEIVGGILTRANLGHSALIYLTFTFHQHRVKVFLALINIEPK